MPGKKSEEKLKRLTTKKPSPEVCKGQSDKKLSEPKESITNSPPTTTGKEENNSKKGRKSLRELFKIKSNHNTPCAETELSNNVTEMGAVKYSLPHTKSMSHSELENLKNSSFPKKSDTKSTSMLSLDIKAPGAVESSFNSDIIYDKENSIEPNNSKTLNFFDTNTNISYYKQLGQQFEQMISELFPGQKINKANGDQTVLEFMRNICSLKSLNEELMCQNNNSKVKIGIFEEELNNSNIRRKKDFKQFQKIHAGTLDIIKQKELKEKSLQEKVKHLETMIRTRNEIHLFYFKKSIEFYNITKQVFEQIIDKEPIEDFNISLKNLIDKMNGFNDIETTNFEPINLIINNFFNSDFIKTFLNVYGNNRYFYRLANKLALLESENIILLTKIQKKKKILKLIENNIGLPSLQNDF